MDRWQRRLWEALEWKGHLRGVHRLLVGVSGGADSVALLRLLAELRAGVAPFPEVAAGHVHHGLRGAEADGDARFVEELAAVLGVRFLLWRGNAREEARRLRLSCEAAGRALRYRAFSAWAAEEAFDAVALAHHVDDLAETVLLRAVRGAGPRGLAAMLPSRPLPGGGAAARLIRPLLDWRRSEILEYLEARRQEFRSDSSNTDLSIPRNTVRHQVLPLLERDVQPGAALSLARLAVKAGELAADVRDLGRRALREATAAEAPATGAPGRPPVLCLALDALRSWPRSVAREALGQAVESVLAASPEAPAPGVPAGPLEQALGWLEAGGPVEARLELKTGALLELRYGRLWVSRHEAKTRPPAIEEAPLFPGGLTAWRGWQFEVEASAGVSAAAGGGAPDSGVMEERFDFDRVAAAGELHLRSRRRGDRLQPLGAPGQKMLKEFFRERQVLPRDRDDVPLVAAGEAIVWVVGHRIAHPFRVRPDTQRLLLLRARRSCP